MAEEKEFLTKHKLDPAEMAGLLSTIRGITLGIVFSEKTFGKLRVDFGINVTMDPEIAKAALLHVLAKRGAMIDEFEEWKPAVKAVHAEERVKGGTQARSSIQELEKATADIRKKMTIKYQVDF